MVKSSPAEKGLGMLLDESLDMPWPYALAPRNPPHTLGSSPVAWTAGKEGILSPGLFRWDPTWRAASSS